jgi:TorA maturation chaperone TorD
MSAPKNTPTLSDATVALERAKLARFMAAMFGDPDQAWFDMLAEPAARMELYEAASSLQIESKLVDGVFRSIDADAANEDAYNRLLGHTVRSECPPYELEYRSSEVFQQAQTLADIAGFYRAFGFDATGPVTERADHLATQWEFLAVLSMMESLAKDADQAACCIAAQRSYLAEHAGAWMPAFFERVRRADAGSFLAKVADLGDAVLRQWCMQLGVSTGPRWLELRAISDEDSTISCGAPGAVELGPTLAAAMEDRD